MTKIQMFETIAYETTKFLFWSDWALAAKAALVWNFFCLERWKDWTSNIERRILMALRFIYFKTIESRWSGDLKTAAFDELSRVEFRRVESRSAFVAYLAQ